MGNALDDYPAFVKARFKTFPTSVETILHAAVGAAGEGGELLDAVKKSWVYNAPLKSENLIEEAGDTLSYIQALANAMGLTLEFFLVENMRKLEKRYPTGYSDAQAQARADKDPNKNAEYAASLWDYTYIIKHPDGRVEEYRLKTDIDGSYFFLDETGAYYGPYKSPEAAVAGRRQYEETYL